MGGEPKFHRWGAQALYMGGPSSIDGGPGSTSAVQCSKGGGPSLDGLGVQGSMGWGAKAPRVGAQAPWVAYTAWTNCQARSM